MRTPTLYLTIAAGAAILAAVLLWPRWLATPAPAPQHAALPAPDDSSESAPATTAASASTPPSATVPSAQPSARAKSGCPSEMVEVRGLYCPFVAHRCDAYVGASPDPSGDYRRDRDRRCQRYRNTLLCEGRPAELHVCVDRYEYPGLLAVKPAVMSTHREAARACAAEGKRLCFADEWAFACEGKRTLPFPYGLERDPGRCQIDRPTPQVNDEALAEPREVSMEVQRLDRRAPSGSQPGCVSPFGVFDTVGNVAEWVVDRQGDSTRASAGGSWGKALGTCRSLESGTRSSHRSHQIGFRCCRDPLDGGPARQLLPAGSRLARRRAIL